MISALKEYEKRKTKYNLLLKKKQKCMDTVSNLRLATFVLGLIILIRMYTLKLYFLFDSVVLVMIVLLCYLAYLHKTIENKKKYITALYEVNETSIKRLKGEWNTFEDIGEDFTDENHNYSYDLDIFGKGSLFQWINTCRTYIGRQKLKKILTEKPENEQNIYDRQSAVIELGTKIHFRQRLEAEGKIICNNKQDPRELFLWIKERSNYILKNQVIWALRVLSMVTTITSLTLVVRILDYVMSVLFDIDKSAPKIFYLIPYYIPIFLIFIQCIILRIKREDRMKNLIIAGRYNHNKKKYRIMLRKIENNKFKSNNVIKICKKFMNMML